jgi:hypothetical protein
MDLAPVRKFLLASYYDLPNILFVGSLVLGSLTGYLSLVWVAMGMIFNWAGTMAMQLFFRFLGQSIPAIGKWISAGKPMDRFGFTVSLSNTDQKLIAPSQWMSGTTFFAVFSLISSINAIMKQAKSSADQEKVDARRAFSFSTLLIGVIFFGLILLRYFTGYESGFGLTTGVLVGGLLAWGYWKMLDTCNAGVVPDVLQVMGSLAPDRKGSQTPVMCVAPPQDAADE